MDKDDPKVVELSEKLHQALHEDEPDHRRRPPRFGIHDDVPGWEYHEWQAYGSGAIRKVGHSPAHFREYWEAGEELRPKLIAGAAFHACVLEPDTEWPKYFRLEDGKDRRHREYREACEEHGPDFVLTAREYDSCEGGRDAVYGHSRLGRLLKDGTPEVSFAWHDADTELPLKGRADWLNTEIATVVDLKQTGDAREHAFRRVARSQGYPVQGAQYTAGLTELGQEAKHYVNVAVESDPPYGVMLYRISTADLIIAESYWRSLVDKLAWCIENDDWPAYPEHTTVLHMGSYWERDVQEEVALLEESMR